MDKKVLIITYYWPPSGGSGVQRWLKFVKYLPHFHWEPHVFTPENPAFAVRDNSLEKDVPAEAEVIRFPIWEPYEMFFKISGIFGPKKEARPTSLVSTKNKSIFQYFSTWIRGNLFIPDPRRFWVRPSVKFLSEYIKDNHIQTIITTGPPHSLHLIGLKLKTQSPQLRWIVDFRDPWTDWGLLDSLMVSGLARKIHRRLERKVLEKADEVITITPFYVNRFQQLSQRSVTLLTNGFDEDDFSGIVYEKTNKFLIRHIGIVNEKCDPKPFVDALNSELMQNEQLAKDLQLEFIGEVHPQFRQYIEGSGMLKNLTLFTGNVPHKTLIKMYGASSVLLIILTGYKDAEGFLPGKLFEYLATGLPILGVGPARGDAAAVLNEAGAGVMLEGNDQHGIRSTIRELHRKWQTTPTPKINPAAKKFSRKEITGKLVQLLTK